MAENDLDDGNDQENGNGRDEQDARATRVLKDIAPRAWEHPADRAALAALRRIPVFDDVLRKLFGFFGEKPIRPGVPRKLRKGLGTAVPTSLEPLSGRSAGRSTRRRITRSSFRRHRSSTPAPTGWTSRSSS